MSLSNSLEVSCVIPVRDGARYLGEALDSVLAQTRPPAEIVLVDDGSVDHTVDVAASYGDSVKYLYQEKAGVSAARNRGVAAASGALVAFLDSDDRWLPHKLECQIDQFRLRPGLGISRGFAQGFFCEELSEEQCRADSRFGDPRYTGRIEGQIITWMVRRELFDSVGPFDEDRRFLEDIDWFTRARDSDVQIATLDQTVAQRRLHAGNTTLGQTSEGLRDLADVLKAHLDRKRGKS
jgi:glycosyltransferase involved in cell wall biosynthesis